MSVKEIMALPYIMFVLGMADAPSIDYEAKKKDNAKVPNTVDEEVSEMENCLK